MGLLNDTVDLDQWENIIFAQGFDLGAAHLPKELFGFPNFGVQSGWAVCMMCHGGWFYLKILLLVVVRNKHA